MIVAIAQISPVVLDRAATTARIVQSIRDAGARGAELVAFGETLLPAYPFWLCRTDAARFEAEDQKALQAIYLEQSVQIERGDLDPVRDAARDARVWVVLGVAERPIDRGAATIYCSCVTISDTGEIASVHRKLMPTHEERLAWGIGDGAGLIVHETGPFRVGSLNCWENWMPLARAALYAQGETLHVAIWPGSRRLTQDITRFIARESRSYVISASAVIRERDIHHGIPSRSAMVSADELIYDGGSCIAAPDGSWLVEPVVGREELILTTLDPELVRRERQSFDPSGHYARPDVLRLEVDRRRQRPAVFRDGSGD